MKRIKNYFFLVFLLHCTTIAFTQKSGSAVFHSLTNEDGLSQSMVTSICRDHKGIMWFGTRDGLNRYDGNHFKIFRHKPGNPQSISSNHITSILSDSSGFLWIGTMGGGINKFDPRTEICKKIHFTHQEGKNVDTSHVVCLLLDSSGNIWGGTKNNGLLLIEPKTHRTEIIPVKSATNPEKNVFIKDMLEDGELIYLATGDEGLIKFLPGQGIVEYIRDFDKSQ